MAKNKLKKKSGVANRIFCGFLLVVLIFYTICLSIPLVWGFYTTFKSPDDWMISEVWPSLNITFINYTTAFSKMYVQVGKLKYYMQHLMSNSLVYAYLNALGVLVSAYTKPFALLLFAYV